MCCSNSVDVLRTFISSVPDLHRRYCGAKRHKPQDTVRSVIKTLTEVEVEGDEHSVQRILQSLKDRRRFPLKFLQFDGEERPPYWGSHSMFLILLLGLTRTIGTWTKKSSVICPRRPFGKDTSTFDYEYDSADDWEPEEDGGEDVASANGSEDEEDEESDEDGWMVGDDEVEFASNVSGTPPPLEDDPFGVLFPKPLPAKKRKAVLAAEGGGRAKRKKIEKLQEWCKGPCWEVSIGRCEYKPWRKSRIQFFNG